MQFSAEEVWQSKTKELKDLLDIGALAPKPKLIRFYVPSFMHYKIPQYRSLPTRFPTISLTGAACSLNCKHCSGKILETMQSTKTPEKLLKYATKLKQQGALGCLLSGGCLQDGSVPFKPFISAIAKIKRELGLTVFVHTGIIDSETAATLKNTGVEAVLIDIIGSDATIRQVYNLKLTTRDYTESLKALDKAGLNFIPHVIVGLHFGKLKGEFQALKMIAEVKPSAIVVIAFMPLQGTAMAKVKAPKPEDIAKVIATARLMFPQTPLSLGCMRPKGKHRTETDILALKAGAEAIAFPSEEAVAYAEAQGYTVSFSSNCCAQIHSDTLRNNSK